MASNDDEELCSFCGKPGSEVRRLIQFHDTVQKSAHTYKTRHRASICEECVRLCVQALDGPDSQGA
jgi:hypothetical protein